MINVPIIPRKDGECHQWAPGIDKSLASELLTEFNLSPRYVDRLEKYYVLHWTGEWFERCNLSGIISHQGIQYAVCYYKCNLRDASEAKQVAISFRKLADPFYPLGYAVVKILAY